MPTNVRIFFGVKVQCVVVSRLRILQFSAWLAYGLECIESLDLVRSWVLGQETIDQEFLGNIGYPTTIV